MDLAALQQARMQRARAAGWAQQPTPGGAWQWRHTRTGQTAHASLDPTTIELEQAPLKSEAENAAAIAAKREELLRKKEQDEQEEKLKRLPPALRARLEKRGVISAGGSAVAGAGGDADAGAATAAAPPAPGANVPRARPPPAAPRGPATGVPRAQPPRGPADAGPTTAQETKSAADGGLDVDPDVPTLADGSAMPLMEKTSNSILDNLPLPKGWSEAKHNGKVFYFNLLTGESQHEHPALKVDYNGPTGAKRKGETMRSTAADDWDKKHGGGRKIFELEEIVLVTELDMGRLIGKNGGNLKMLRAAVEQNANNAGQLVFPPKNAKPDAKALNGKPAFTIRIQAETKTFAKKGKKAIMTFLASQKALAECIKEAGLTVVLPEKKDDKNETAATAGSNKRGAQVGPTMSASGQSKVKEEFGQPVLDPFDSAGAWAKRQKKEKPKGSLDLMDPSAYCDAPQGGWSVGMERNRNAELGDDHDFQQYR